MASDVDQLIAQLAAEGELDGTGGFTLDPAVALAKLREHQLRDPTLFVLCWVRAAVLLGATRIDIEIDADDVYLRFDGESLTERDFDHLWSAGVGSRGSPQVQACRELALGINGVFAWGAKHASVSGGGLRVAFDREFAMQRVKLGEPTAGNVIHAKRPLGWDLVRRRTLDQRNQLPEELLLASACAYADVAIVLEGQPLNRDWTAPLDPWVRLDIDDDDRRGVLILHGGGGPSCLRVLKAGVQVALVELPYPHVEAVIDDRLLPLDLSQEKPVEGERWAALLDRVDQARWQAWFELAAREGWSGLPQQPLHQALLEAVLASPDLRWTEVPGAGEFAAKTRCRTALSNPEGGFRALTDQSEPLLRPFAVPEPPVLTLAELVERIGRGERVFTSAGVREELPIVPELPVLLFAAPPNVPHWRPLERPEHMRGYWQAAQERRRLYGAELLRQGWPCLEFTHEHMQVRVAWVREVEGEQGALIIGRDGKRLGDYRLPVDWGPLWAEVEGPFEVEPGLGLDRHLGTAVLAMLSRYHELIAAVLAQPDLRTHEQLLLQGDALVSPGRWTAARESVFVCMYMREAFGRWSARRLAELTHIPGPEQTHAIAVWRGDWGVPSQWTGLDGRAAAPHPLDQVAWLLQDGRMLSLAELRAASERGPLYWIDREASPDVALPAEILRLDADERRRLELLLPDALQPFDLHAHARREAGSMTLPDTLSDVCSFEQRFAGSAGMRGILALPERELPREWSGASCRGARLHVLTNGHPLGCMDVPLPLGPFFGVIELPNARPLAHTDQIAKDQTWHSAAAVVESTALALARTQLEAWRDRCDHPHDIARARHWFLDLERGAWPQLAAELSAWLATLALDHPLRRELARAGAVMS